MGTMRTVEVKPTPHRFRHTFARIILQRGVSVRDVADLLGNSEQMVRGHYAAWIPERQARLTKILAGKLLRTGQNQESSTCLTP
jgi:integrase